MHPSTMLMQLDAETRELQPRVDSRWLDLLAGTVTRDIYLRQLACTYGFEAPTECALTYTPNLVVANRRERTRSGLIVQDLLALGMSPARITALPQCRDIAAFDDAAEALAWKYVLERPTQLHAAIRRNVLGRLPELANAVTYLSACDGVAAARWQQLGMLLDDVALRHRASSRIVAAARAAFELLDTWNTSGEVDVAVAR
jgi:heme oxygenase